MADGRCERSPLRRSELGDDPPQAQEVSVAKAGGVSGVGSEVSPRHNDAAMVLCPPVREMKKDAESAMPNRLGS